MHILDFSEHSLLIRALDLASSLPKDKITKAIQDICSICLDPICFSEAGVDLHGKEIIVLHKEDMSRVEKCIFHIEKCLSLWTQVQFNCPNCRDPLKFFELKQLFDEDFSQQWTSVSQRLFKSYRENPSDENLKKQLIQFLSAKGPVDKDAQVKCFTAAVKNNDQEIVRAFLGSIENTISLDDWGWICLPAFKRGNKPMIQTLLTHRMIAPKDLDLAIRIVGDNTEMVDLLKRLKSIKEPNELSAYLQTISDATVS